MIIAETSETVSGSSDSDSTVVVILIVLATSLVVCIIAIIGLVLRHQRLSTTTRTGNAFLTADIYIAVRA